MVNAPTKNYLFLWNDGITFTLAKWKWDTKSKVFKPLFMLIHQRKLIVSFVTTFILITQLGTYYFHTLLYFCMLLNHMRHKMNEFNSHRFSSFFFSLFFLLFFLHIFLFRSAPLHNWRFLWMWRRHREHYIFWVHPLILFTIY